MNKPFQKYAGWLILTVLAGCNRNDTEALGRLGQKVLERAKASTARLRHQSNIEFPSLTEPPPRAKVAYRLEWEQTLANSSIEVRLVDNQIELTGRVQNEEQRQRAIQLAESTAGVEKVKDSLRIEP